MRTKKKVVLIDDEEDFCFFVKQNLTQAGEFDVVYATDPNKGIKLIRKESPDLILLDILMSKKDGFSVLEALKNDNKTTSIPVVMLTALGDDDSRLKAFRLYGEDYITKPVSVDTLKEKIGAVLKRHKTLRC